MARLEDATQPLSRRNSAVNAPAGGAHDPLAQDPDRAQGPLFAPPLPEEAVLSLLQGQFGNHLLLNALSGSADGLSALLAESLISGLGGVSPLTADGVFANSLVASFQAGDGPSADGAAAEGAAVALHANAEAGDHEDAEAAVMDRVGRAMHLAGRPLPPAVAARMSAAFGGADFSEVRIHTGPTAAAASDDLSAHAFTVEQDIFFGGGEWDPNSVEGQRLLAHELTHVLQHQRGQLQPSHGEGLEVSSPSDPTELEAVSTANQVVADLHSGPQPGPDAPALSLEPGAGLGEGASSSAQADTGSGTGSASSDAAVSLAGGSETEDNIPEKQKSEVDQADDQQKQEKIKESAQGNDGQDPSKREFAVKVADTPSDSPQVNTLRTKLSALYSQQKSSVEGQLDQLDQGFQDASQDRVERQNYLAGAIKQKVYEARGKALADQGGNKSAYKFKADSGFKKAATTLGKKTDALDQMAENLAAGIGSDDKSEIHNTSLSTARHAIGDPIAQDYEEGLLNATQDEDALLKGMRAAAGAQGLEIQESDGADVVHLSVTINDKPEDIGTVFKGNAQYEKSGELQLDDGEIREIFKKIGTEDEFVQDAADVFTPRTVQRYLNQYDDPASNKIEVSPSKPKGAGPDDPSWREISEDIPSWDGSKRDAEAFKHMRGKEAQGGSPFISTTASTRPIFGSTGQRFESEHGSAQIDLARIAKSRVLNTYAPDARERITGVRTPDPRMPFKDGDPDFEKNAASRDALRTAEVVIGGNVPAQAIRGYNKGGQSFSKKDDGSWAKR